MLEKQDRPNPRSNKPFIPLTARNNVYQAWGSYIKDPVGARDECETAQGKLARTHVHQVSADGSTRRRPDRRNWFS